MEDKQLSHALQIQFAAVRKTCDKQHQSHATPFLLLRVSCEASYPE